MNPKRPKPSEPFLDARGLITRPWFNYLADLSPSETSAAIAEQLQVLGLRVDALEDTGGSLPSSTMAYGVLSIQSNGTLAAGKVVFNLVNDVQSPGNTLYYGTGPDGLKGWFNVSDAIEVEAGQLTKAVGDDGVTTLGLAEVEDSGGGTLQRFERDAKGRVSGTSEATTDDLPEGIDNLYFNTERAAAAAPVQSVNGATGVVVLDAGDVGADLSGSAAAAQAAAETYADGKVANTIIDGVTDVAPSQNAVFDALAGKESAIAVGTTGQFWRGDKAWSDTILGGFRASSNVGLGGWQLSARNPSTSSGVSAWVDLSTGNGWAGKVGSVEGEWVAALAYSSGQVIAGGTTAHFSSLQDFRCQKNVASYEMVSSGAVNGWRFLGNVSDSVNFGFGIDYLSAGVWTSAYVFNQSSLFPVPDNARSCGDASFRWSVVYAATGTINTSDAREKTAPRDLTPTEISCALDIARLPCIFQWLESIAEKGEGARLHASPTVQSVIATMEAHGLDPFRYSFVCYDVWPERPEVVESWREERDENGNVTRQAGSRVMQPYQAAGDRYSLRPSGLDAFCRRALVADRDALDARLSALETGSA